jgi:hypothetical protein
MSQKQGKKQGSNYTHCENEWRCEKIYTVKNKLHERNFNEMGIVKEKHSFQLHTCAGVTCMGC